MPRKEVLARVVEHLESITAANQAQRLAIAALAARVPERALLVREFDAMGQLLVARALNDRSSDLYVEALQRELQDLLELLSPPKPQ